MMHFPHCHWPLVIFYVYSSVSLIGLWFAPASFTPIPQNQSAITHQTMDLQSMSGVKIPSEKSNMYVPDFFMDFFLHEHWRQEVEPSKIHVFLYVYHLINQTRGGTVAASIGVPLGWMLLQSIWFQCKQWMLRLPWQPSHTLCGLNLKCTVITFFIVHSWNGSSY